ncbi:MAG TPA: hypothetical protein VH878_04150 [Thermodesulfobacteriota bacterium]
MLVPKQESVIINNVEQNSQDIDVFDNYIRGIDDQELKGILLKLKNESRKPGASWEQVRKTLQALWNKNKEMLIDIVPLILK